MNYFRAWDVAAGLTPKRCGLSSANRQDVTQCQGYLSTLDFLRDFAAWALTGSCGVFGAIRHRIVSVVRRAMDRWLVPRGSRFGFPRCPESAHPTHGRSLHGNGSLVTRRPGGPLPVLSSAWHVFLAALSSAASTSRAPFRTLPSICFAMPFTFRFATHDRRSPTSAWSHRRKSTTTIRQQSRRAWHAP